MTLRAALDPILHADVLHWQGLPTASVAEFDALFGTPAERAEATLGYHPATRHRYPYADTPGLVLWSRDGVAVMFEAPVTPPLPVLDALGTPDRVLPHEILVPDAYAHEYLYCARGLVLTVAQALRGGADRIVRCRGIRPLTGPTEFGPAYYRAFEDQVQWSPLDVGGA